MIVGRFLIIAFALIIIFNFRQADINVDVLETSCADVFNRFRCRGGALLLLMLDDIIGLHIVEKVCQFIEESTPRFLVGL